MSWLNVRSYPYRREREAFHDRILDARMHPTKAMSINIDGMDQQTTHVPSFSYKDKDTEDSLIQVHLTGMIMSSALIVVVVKSVDDVFMFMRLAVEPVDKLA